MPRRFSVKEAERQKRILFALINSYPGKYFVRSAADELKIGDYTSSRYLDELEESGDVYSISLGIGPKKRVFFPTGFEYDMNAVKVFHLTEKERAVYSFIRENPGSKIKDIRSGVNESRQVINRNVKMLREHGLVRCEGDIYYYPAEKENKMPEKQEPVVYKPDFGIPEDDESAE